MPDITPPEIVATPPRLSRDEAAAAWFLFLDSIAEMYKMPHPGMHVLAKGSLMTAVRVGEKIRGAPLGMIETVIRENARPEIISGS